MLGMPGSMGVCAIPGDLNIAPAPVDAYWAGSHTVFKQQPHPVWLQRLLDGSFQDVFRKVHPGRRGAVSPFSRAVCPACSPANVPQAYAATAPCARPIHLERVAGRQSPYVHPTGPTTQCGATTEAHASTSSWPRPRPSRSALWPRTS